MKIVLSKSVRDYNIAVGWYSSPQKKVDPELEF